MVMMGVLTLALDLELQGFGMSIYPAGTTMKWVDSDLSKTDLLLWSSL